ncbi:uncharacterized protein LOC113290984 [Papaver somniferum]|uniref:uncharacterized protein LOC113290984 n=1 Tax=Papaver somniferum TaxID=3469 RepID=UPI000E6F73DB|nr:uncharacterized protein LOC113290984 [Papaver somniferum]
MDQIKHHQMQQTTEGSNGVFQKPDNLLKKPTILQFLISLLSILSLILSYSSSQIPAFSSLSFHLFTYTIDRKYMFLLCNGILVFLARNFEFLSSTDQHQQYFSDKLSTGNVDQLWLKPEVLEVDGYEGVFVKESTGTSETCDDELLVIDEGGKEVTECLKEEEYELMTTKDSEKDEKIGTLFTKDDEEEDAKIHSHFSAESNGYPASQIDVAVLTAQ